NWALQTGMPIYRMAGRTLGILGFGKIGQTLAQKARGLGLRLIAHDAFMSDEAILKHQVEPVSLDALFAQSDFLSVHTPLTSGTRGLVDAERLRRMKPTAFLVNTSRGAVID